MTFFPETFIRFANTTSIDAFSRLRTTGRAVTLFDSKQVFSGSNGIVWDTKIVSGSSTSHNVDRASTMMTVTTASGSSAIRQTKQYINYQPGKSLLTFQTFVLGTSVDGVIKRAGRYEDNNGIYLEQSGSSVNMCLRSSVSGTPIVTSVSQSAWNLDTMDGSGPSTKTLDLSKAQIYFSDLEWLGVGRVRTGFVIGGVPIAVHEFTHSNIIDSAYMSTPNLPFRFEIENFGSAVTASLEHICASAISEGGYDPLGITRSADRDAHAIAISSGSLAPVISIKLASHGIGATVIPTDISLMSTTNASFRWTVFLNPTISGSDNVNWQSVPNGSVVEYDVSRDTTNTLSSGVLIASGYVEAGNKAAGEQINRALKSSLFLSADIDGDFDEIVVGIRSLETSTESFLASISWRELL